MFDNFGTYLKKYRKLRNLTQQQFAELLNINDKYLSRIENNKVIPSYKVLNGFLNFSRMTMQQLVRELDNFTNDTYNS